MKLSEKLNVYAWRTEDSDFARQLHADSDDAQALEERVTKCEEFEAMAARVHNAVKAERDAANARVAQLEDTEKNLRAYQDIQTQNFMQALDAGIATAIARAEAAEKSAKMFQRQAYAAQEAHQAAEGKLARVRFECQEGVKRIEAAGTTPNRRAENTRLAYADILDIIDGEGSDHE